MYNYLTYTNKSDSSPLSKKITVLCGLIFVYSSFSGAIRKWGGASDLVSNVVFGIQLLLPFLFILLKKRGYQTPFNNQLIFFTAVLFIMAINPMNLTIFHGLFGLLIHLGFWICCFFYVRNRELFNLKSIIWLFILVAVVEIVLAFIQFNLPSTHFLNAYANEGEVSGIATFNSKVRVTGTFSYLGGFYAFFTFFPLLLWGLIRLQYSKYIIVLLFLAGVVACFMSGSRSTMYTYLIIGILIVYSERGLKMLLSTVMGILVVVGILSGMTYFLGDKFHQIGDTVTLAYDNFQGRRKLNAESGEENQRIAASINDVIFFPGEYPLLGVGLGATYQGSTSTFGTSSYVLDYPSYYEEEPERIVIEGGFVLLFLRIMLFVAFFRFLRIPVFAKIVLGIVIFLYIPTIYNTYNAVFVSLGLIFLDSTYKDQKDHKKHREKEVVQPGYVTA